MPRSARKKSINGMYHIMIRGADRRIIFGDDEDCRTFMNIVSRIKAKHPFNLYACCLMGNHVHMLIREGEESVGVIIKRLGVTYVAYYNQKYDLLGHLFQDRFRSEAVETQAYFLDVLRYICQNPVKAGLCKTPKEYRWLSCSGLRADNVTDSLEEYTHLAGEDLRLFLNGPCTEDHMDEASFRLTDRMAIERLCRICGCRNVQEIGGWSEKQQNEAIRAGRKAGISIRQLSRLTGISKTRIEKIR